MACGGSGLARPRTEVRPVSDVAPSDCVCRSWDSESDAESARGWSLPVVEVVAAEASLPISAPMEVGECVVRPSRGPVEHDRVAVSATPRAPLPRLRIAGTQRDTVGKSLPSTVPTASPLPRHVSRGRPSGRFAQSSG